MPDQYFKSGHNPVVHEVRNITTS